MDSEQNTYHGYTMAVPTVTAAACEDTSEPVNATTSKGLDPQKDQASQNQCSSSQSSGAAGDGSAVSSHVVPMSGEPSSSHLVNETGDVAVAASNTKDGERASYHNVLNDPNALDLPLLVINGDKVPPMCEDSHHVVDVLIRYAFKEEVENGEGQFHHTSITMLPNVSQRPFHFDPQHPFNEHPCGLLLPDQPADVEPFLSAWAWSSVMDVILDHFCFPYSDPTKVNVNGLVNNAATIIALFVARLLNLTPPGNGMAAELEPFRVLIMTKNDGRTLKQTKYVPTETSWIEFGLAVLEKTNFKSLGDVIHDTLGFNLGGLTSRRQTKLPERCQQDIENFADYLLGESGFSLNTASSSSGKSFQNNVPASSSTCSSMSATDEVTIPTAAHSIQALPVEITNSIINYLCREDIKSLRLVNRSFNWKVTGRFFESVVIPFGLNMYDVNATVSKQNTPAPTFQTWGSHFRKCCFSYEISEHQLSDLPRKRQQRNEEDFFGAYSWHTELYDRFPYLRALEVLGEDPKGLMSSAIAELKDLHALGFSFNNGLGWLHGPDMSDRSKHFAKPTPVFGQRFHESKATLVKRQRDWVIARIRASTFSLRGYTFFYDPSSVSVWQIDQWPRIFEEKKPFYRFRDLFDSNGNAVTLIVKSDTNSPVYMPYWYPKTLVPLVFNGSSLLNPIEREDQIARSTVTYPTPRSIAKTFGLSPRFLTKEQQEYLMETKWAQEAFLSSTILSVTDNPLIFGGIRTLVLAKLPASYLSHFDRIELWNTFKGLEDLTIRVLQEWRELSQQDSKGVPISYPGVNVFSAIRPSSSYPKFYDILSKYINHREGLKKLTIGYVGGGEHETGLFGRNRHLLPAPLVANIRDQLEDAHLNETLLSFSNVTELTLENCWIGPSVLKQFLRATTRKSNMEVLNLISVSLVCTENIKLTVNLPSGYPLQNRQHNWMFSSYNRGSWSDILNGMIPSTLARFRFADTEYYSSIHTSNPVIDTINFQSCGYAKLVNAPERVNIDQSSLNPQLALANGDEGPQMPQWPLSQSDRYVPLEDAWLKRRYNQLVREMLPDVDPYSGRIHSSLLYGDGEYLSHGFGMKIGWDEDIRKWENLEDGVYVGGEGRFSGILSQHNQALV